MKAKIILILSIILSSLTLTACDPFAGWRGYGQESGANGKSNYFKDVRGENVWTCKRNVIQAHEGNSYLKKYGLPLEIGGNFTCDGDTPKLPKDCQGREIRSEAELNAYTSKHQLPQGMIIYDCSTGTPKIPSHQLEYWKKTERNNPTCKDARGRKRPCV